MLQKCCFLLNTDSDWLPVFEMRVTPVSGCQDQFVQFVLLNLFTEELDDVVVSCHSSCHVALPLDVIGCLLGFLSSPTSM